MRYLALILNLFSTAVQSWSPSQTTPTSERASPPNLLSHNRHPLPTTFSTKLKRDQPQCLWPVKTWPNGGDGYSITTITQGCAPSPWNAAGSPITQNIPIIQNLPPQISTVTWPSPTQPNFEPSTSIASFTPAANTGEAKVLGLGYDGVLALVVLLPLAAVVFAIGELALGCLLGRRDAPAPLPHRLPPPPPPTGLPPPGPPTPPPGPPPQVHIPGAF